MTRRICNEPKSLTQRPSQRSLVVQGSSQAAQPAGNNLMQSSSEVNLVLLDQCKLATVL